METQLRGWVTPAVVGVASFIGGAVGGYFFRRYQDSRKVIATVVDNELVVEENEFESRLTQMQFMFEERDRKYDTQLQQVMRVATAALQPIVHDGFKTQNEAGDVTFAVESEEQEWNEETDDDWDYDVEVPLRGPENPYIIHRDEFFADEEGYDNHSSLTYYKGDDILCDELDVPIYNAERITGPLIFGHGSQDPHIVYIRNPRLKAEYEVLLEYGTFADEILGQKVHKSLEAEEFKHSLLKFREE